MLEISEVKKMNKMVVSDLFTLLKIAKKKQTSKFTFIDLVLH